MCESKTWVCLVLLIAAISIQANAAEGTDIFADPQNLQVIDKGISPDELRDTMKSFALGTGFALQSLPCG